MADEKKNEEMDFITALERLVEATAVYMRSILRPVSSVLKKKK